MTILPELLCLLLLAPGVDLLRDFCQLTPGNRANYTYNGYDVPAGLSYWRQGMTIVKKCKRGYVFKERQPSISARCHGGTWKPSLATCVPAHCNLSPEVSRHYEHNKKSIDPKLVPVIENGVNIRVRCQRGYVAKGTETPLTVTCNESIWTPPLPKCIPGWCQIPETKGIRFSVGPIAVPPEVRKWENGFTIRVDCQEKFTPDGAGVPVNVTCRAGVWKPKLPTCVPAPEEQRETTLVFTTQPPPSTAAPDLCDLTHDEGTGFIYNNIPVPSDVTQWQSGLGIEVKCRRGYHIPGRLTPSTAKCQSGTWKPPLQKCVSAWCDIPTQNGVKYTINDAVILPSVNRLENGMQMSVSCAQGFSPKGRQRLLVVKCDQGTWDPPLVLPKCIPDPTENGASAERPESISQQGIEGSAFCNLVHQAGRMFQQNRKTIPPYVTQWDGGVSLEVNCVRGFVSKGRPTPLTTVCTGGSWTPPIPECISAWCHLPDYEGVLYDIDGERIKPHIDQLENGIALNVQCTQGYNSVGTSTPVKVLCKDGTWQPTLPNCTRAFCILRQEARRQFKYNKDAIPAGISRWENGTSVKMTCSQGYVIKSKKPSSVEAKCDGTDWQPPFPKCVPGWCTLPQGSAAHYMAYGKWVPPGINRWENGMTLQTYCSWGDGQFVTSQCRKGTWDPSLPDCSEEY